jgi:ribonuclease HII
MCRTSSWRNVRCCTIAAGSIVAKVTRDRLMQDLHLTDPRYGFDRHKGYATADHLAAVAQHGYSPVHRRSFRPHTHTMLDAARAGAAAALPQD